MTYIAPKYYIRKRIKLFASAGMVANIFLYSKYTSFVTKFGEEKKSSRNDRDLNNFCLSVTAGVGAAYDINQRLSLRTAPAYTRMVTPIHDAPIGIISCLPG